MARKGFSVRKGAPNWGKKGREGALQGKNPRASLPWMERKALELKQSDGAGAGGWGPC